MSFKHNIGKTDKWTRIILGIVMITIGYYVESWLWGIVGLIIFFTGIFDWCLIYKISGISTRKKNVDNSDKQKVVSTDK